MVVQLTDKRIGTMLRLCRRAFGRYRWQIVILTALGFLSGMLEAIGVNALIPLFSFIVGEAGGSDDFITRTIRDLFTALHIPFSLKFLMGFMVGLFILKAVVVMIFNYVRIRIDTDYEERNRNELFASVMRARWPYLLKQKIGYLENVLMVDVLRGSVLLRQISNIIMLLTGLVMYVLVAINISLTATLITLALGGFLFLLFKPLLYKTRVYASRTSVINKNVAHYVNENIMGMKTVKSMGAGGEVAARGRRYFRELAQLKTVTFMLSSLSSSLIQPVSLIFIVVVFAVAYKMPGFNFAALIAVVYLIQRMFQHIQNLQSNLHQASDALPYLKNVLEYKQKADEHREQDRGKRDFSFRKLIEFKNVSFTYQQGQPVLSGVDFNIQKGEMVGLIGESGSGKTTIVDLLLRLFDAGQGEIVMDGNNIADISIASWRANVGYVSQDVFLINDTITNNIRFFDDSLTNKDIAEAAKMANIHEFIQSCSKGFDTIVGDRGIMLSAGQRQRIAIARVLARKPKLLILDEATSALDNESEAKIQNVIENLHGKVTVLIVAHRLTTVMHADKLIVLTSGRIIEEGKPHDLLADKKSYFHKLSNIGKQPL